MASVHRSETGPVSASSRICDRICDRYDVVVVGGGPAGTTFGRMMCERGFDTLIVERGRHPRFSVGESLLPGTMPVWQELGLLERFEEAGFVRKYGSYFCFADGKAPVYFPFPNPRRVSAPHAYEVPRARFDELLWNGAIEAGVHCADRTAAERFCFDGDRATGVELRLPDGSRTTVRSRLVADCSGSATQLARQLGTRQRRRRLDKVALYCHYDDVVRSVGEDAGTIAIVATAFGWMWLIPFAGGAASVGAVIERSWYAARRKAGSSNDAVWSEVLSAVPAVSRRLFHARQTRPVEAVGDFEYQVDPIAGDGWVVIGDAGAFVDPVFSSGVHLAVTGARRASRAAAAALANGRLPRARDFARYVRRSRASLRVYSMFIHAWYDPAFRAVFMRPAHGRLGVELLKREVLSVLAGAELPAWRALPSIRVLLWIARFSRAAPQAEAPL
jgi:flavin-dependent dehydrogenase